MIFVVSVGMISLGLIISCFYSNSQTTARDSPCCPPHRHTAVEQEGGKGRSVSAWAEVGPARVRVECSRESWEQEGGALFDCFVFTLIRVP